MQELCELFTLPSYEADIFSLRFSPAGTYLAIGLGDGTVSIVSGKTGKPLALVPASTAGLGTDASAAPSTMGLPITALRWRPEAGTQFRVSEATTAKDVLLAAGSDGVIRHIHANSGRVLSTIVEEGAQIYACDYRGDAQRFATVGSTKSVRVYDESTRAVIADMSKGSQLPGLSPYDFQHGSSSARRSSPPEEVAHGTGHSNRVFAVAWHPSEGEGNILATGGWDNTVQIWDLRVGCAVRSIYGPHLGGDGLSFTPDGKHLITASWRTKNQLQVWDWATGALRLSMPWGESNLDCAESIAEASTRSKHPGQAYEGGPRLYGCALAPGGGLLLAGGSGVSEAKVFSVSEMLRVAGAGGKPCTPPAAPLVATVTGLERGVFAMDWCGSDTLAVAGGDAPTRVLQLKGVEAWPGRAAGAGKGSSSSGGSSAGAGHSHHHPPHPPHHAGEKAGSGVWGVDGDALLMDYSASPDPSKPLGPPARVRRAQEAAFAAASSGGGSSSSSSTASALVGGGGGSKGSPTAEEKAAAHPVVSLLSPGPKSLRKGSAAMRAVGQARELSAAASSVMVGGGGSSSSSSAPDGVQEEEEEEDGDEEEEEAPEEPKGFLSRLSS